MIEDQRHTPRSWGPYPTSARACIAAALCLVGLLGSPPDAQAHAARLVRDIDLTRAPHLPPSCPLSPCPLPEPFFGSVVNRLTPFGDKILFSADDGLTGLEPWVSDGTESGTYQLADAALGEDGSSPIFLGSSGNRAVLWAASANQSGNWRVWSTDGIANGLTPVDLPCGSDCDPELGEQHPTIPYEGDMLFWVRDLGSRHRQLYRTDGTSSGTALIKDLCDSVAECERRPDDMTAWNSGVVFSESAFGEGGRAWYLAAGASTPEAILETCRYFGDLAEWQGELVFTASCGSDPSGLYALSTPHASPRRIHGLAGGSATDLLTTSDRLFLSVNAGPTFESDRQIWISDGSEAGTVSLASFDYVFSLGVFADDLLLAARSYDGEHVVLWRLGRNGEPMPLTEARVTTELMIVDDQVFFGAHDANHGVELWTSNGSPQGTQLLADIFPGPASSNPTRAGAGRSGFAVAGGSLYFAANHPDYDIELWTIPLGTEPVPTLCLSDSQAICLRDRFRVTVNWGDHGGHQGTGQAVPLASDTGAFWFFDQGNLELMVKVIDGCGSTWNSYWVFAGGLTDVEVTLQIEDLLTGQVREYSNPLGDRFQPIQDTAAFLTCDANGD